VISTLSASINVLSKDVYPFNVPATVPLNKKITKKNPPAMKMTTKSLFLILPMAEKGLKFLSSLPT